MASSLLRRPGRGALAAAVLAASVTLASCFAITGQSISQEDVIGDVVVTTELCVKNPFPVGECEAGLDQATPGDNQFVVAYLVDDWVPAPTSVSWDGPAGASTLTPSEAFATAIAGRFATGTGRKWLAYASGRLPALTESVDYRATAMVRFAIPEGSPSTMALATVSGWRLVRDATESLDALPIDRPVDCEEQATGAVGNVSTTCAISTLPTDQPTTPGEPTLATNVALSTLSVSAPSGPAAQVTAGETVTLAFDAQGAQADGAPETVPAGATTTIPGASIEAPTSVSIDGASTATVEVQVPTGTAPGTYEVELEAAGGLRSAVAQLQVVAPIVPTPTPTPAPTPTPVPTPGATPPVVATPVLPPSTNSIASAGPEPTPRARTLQESVDELTALLRSPARVREIRRGRVFDLPLHAPVAGRLVVRVDRKVKVNGRTTTQTLARGTRVASSAGPAVVKLVPTRAGAHTLSRSAPYRGTLRVTLRTPAGEQRARPARVRFR